jgi:hypothetical protein
MQDTDDFYSDRTQGPVPRVLEEITSEVWRGLVALVARRLEGGYLAREFPERNCPDGSAITGTDRIAFYDTLGALVPQLRQPESERSPATRLLDPNYMPTTPVALDVVDFVADHIAEPVHLEPHRYCQSDHIYFNYESTEEGQRKFRSDIDRLFGRNGIAFTVGDDMKVTRLGPPESRPLLEVFAPNTGDTELDNKLRDAHRRFLSPRAQDRLDALEKLWDAFERLKTLEDPTDKKASVTRLLDRAALGSKFRDKLELECKELTRIGNDFHIRHFEHDKEALPAPTEITGDYLFVRLAAMIAYLLRRTGRM